MKFTKYMIAVGLMAFAVALMGTQQVEAAVKGKTYELGYGLDWTFETNKKETKVKGYNKAGELKGVYVRGKGSLNGISIGDSKKNVLKKLSNSKIDRVRYKSYVMLQIFTNKYGNETHGMFSVNGEIFTVFYDNHKGDKVVALLSVDTETIAQVELYAQKSKNYEKDFNTVTIMLQNQTRLQHGLKPVQDITHKWGHVAKAHSDDMIKNGFFGHKGSDGKRAVDRMKRNKITFKSWGENLAHGYESVFHAHEALMNSLGHRKVILLPKVTKAYAGTSFDKNNLPYLTVNYYN